MTKPPQKIKKWRSLMACLSLLCLSLSIESPGHAQLATSFYNVTGIETHQLPNGVQVVIQTDGAIQFSADPGELPDATSSDGSVTTLRFHIYNARPHLPSFVDIGAYPIDSAVIHVGGNALEVDLDLRFYVPVNIVNVQTQPSRNDWPDWLQPLQADVIAGDDRSSIIITCLSDHRAAKIKAIDPNVVYPSHLSVDAIQGGGLPTATMHIKASHANLTEMLNRVSALSGVSITTDPSAAKTIVSLTLPDTTMDGLLHALAVGYGLVVSKQESTSGIANYQYFVAKGGSTTVTTSLPLRYLTAEHARILFPDFLLPILHVDTEHQSLVVNGSPELIERIRKDLERFDIPRPQVRVQATVWEFASNEDAQYALSLTRAIHGESEAINSDTGAFSVHMEPGQQRAFSAALLALAEHGRARLAAQPSLLIASGESGTLFLGQIRYVTVLQQRDGQQVADALQVQVGYSLVVRPLTHSGDEIFLNLHPKITTVDAIQDKTGLPILGIREVVSNVQLRSGDTVMVAGLNSEATSPIERRSPLSWIPLIGQLFTSREKHKSYSHTLVLVTAQKV